MQEKELKEELASRFIDSGYELQSAYESADIASVFIYKNFISKEEVREKEEWVETLEVVVSRYEKNEDDLGSFVRKVKNVLQALKQ